ncbi:MAG: PrsW family glutamic-type intramembrane protease [bacterium]|nr:PrsW family glutamic-type intramembrane protease [bacterium]
MKKVESFFLGIIAALGALFLEAAILNFFEPASFANNEIFSFGYVFFAAIAIEEFLKIAVILKALPKKNNAVFNALFFGLGFSFLEIALVYWNNQNGITYDFWGIFGIFLVHISTSLVIGYSLIGDAKKSFLIYLQVFITILITHSSYNILSSIETAYQKQFMYYLLGFLILLDVFLIFKSRGLKKYNSV